jgi:hypothetical protein
MSQPSNPLNAKSPWTSLGKRKRSQGRKKSTMEKISKSGAQGNHPEPIIILKNSTERLQFSLEEYEGHRYADLRVHYRNDSDEFVPTRKGITVSPARWPAFREAVEALERQMEEEGLLS